MLFSRHALTIFTGIIGATVAVSCSRLAHADVRPEYQLLHFGERWIPPADGWDGEDPYDPMKHIALGEDGYITFGGDARTRFETWSNFAFGTPAESDDNLLFYRLSLFADVHVNDDTRIFGEVLSANVTERQLPGGKRPIDTNTLDLKNLFIDQAVDFEEDRRLTLRLGRQQFAFGKQRLISALPWANSFNRWDGVSALYEDGDWLMHGFATYFTPVQQYKFDEPDNNDAFFGIYATRSSHWDIYYLGRQRRDLDETRHTLGMRYDGRIAEGRLDYEFETAWQFGDRGGKDVAAGMFTGILGYTFQTVAGKPRIALAVDWASGDDDPNDNRFGTFDQMKPLGHAYLGYIDLVGRQNILDWSQSIDWHTPGGWALKLTSHYFQLATRNDALYNPAGGVVRRNSASASDGRSKDVGVEIDFTAAKRINRHWTLLFGYSQFHAGEFIRDTGEDETVRFGYGMLNFHF